MPTTFYLDYTKGNAANDGLGWRKIAYTSGGVAEIVAGDIIVGATSGATATVDYILLTGGTWAGGDAAGTIYLLDNQTLTFQAENLNVAGKQNDIATVGGDSAICSKKNINDVTAALTAPGDTIRIAKSPDPIPLGVTSTWTQGSATVTLSSAVTKSIDMCETAWSSDQGANVVATRDTYKAQGTYSAKLDIKAGAGVGLAAHRDALGATTDFSSFQQVCFWINNSVALANGDLQILFGNDAACASIVETFNIPAIATTGCWVPVLIDKGSPLASDIRSVGIKIVNDTGAQIVCLDNIMACYAPTDDKCLTLLSLISTSSDKQISTKPWHAIKGIDGTTITLASYFTAMSSSGLYGLATENDVACYRRETIKVTSQQAIQEGGSLVSPSTYKGGYSPDTGLCDSETFYDLGYCNNSSSFTMFTTGIKDYLILERLNAVRASSGFSTGSSSNNIIIRNCSSVFCNYTGIYIAGFRSLLSNCFCIQSYNNIYCDGSDNIIKDCVAYSGAGDAGVTLGANNICQNTISSYNSYSGVDGFAIKPSSTSYRADNVRMLNCITSNNGGSGVVCHGSGGSCYLMNCLIGATEFTSSVSASFFSQAHDQSGNNCYGVQENGTYVTSADGAGGIKWVISPLVATDIYNPITLPLGSVFCVSGTTYTVTATVNRSDAECYGTLMARGGQIAGITADQSETTHGVAASDEDLVITLSPTADGVVNIELLVYGGTTRTLELTNVTVSPAFDTTGLVNDVDMSIDGCAFVTNIETGGGTPTDLGKYIMRIVGSNEG